MKRHFLPVFVACLIIPSAWSRPVNFQRATSVLGQPDFTTVTGTGLRANSFVQAEAIVIEPVTGKVFISDYSGNRILRFSSVAAYQTNASAEAVLGQPDFDSGEALDPPTASSLYGPGSMAFDSQGSLYVADYNNRRVLRWDDPTTIASGAPADAVIGQADFTSKVAPGVGPHSLFQGPWALDIDAADNLYVGDYSFNRVLRFADAPNLSGNTATADAVFGQPDLSGLEQGSNPGPGPTLTQGILNNLWAIHIDPAGRLWIGDYSNHRILRFDNAATKASGALPDAVLGQPDFSSTNPALTASGLYNPTYPRMDANGTLWVSDFRNSRVLGYRNAGTRPATGVNNADIVLGQPDFTSDQSATTSDRFLSFPYGIAVTPAGGLFVADSLGKRVLHFRSESPILRAGLLSRIAATRKALIRARKAGKPRIVRRLTIRLRSLNQQLAELG
jgi:hypothetical protein